MPPNRGAGAGGTDMPSTSTESSRVGASGNASTSSPTVTTSTLPTSSLRGSTKAARVNPSAGSSSRVPKPPVSSRSAALTSQRASTKNLTNASKPTPTTSKPTKSTQYTLSLSPSAHPRTDPLAALTALRKLLLSLVSSASNTRMGGCGPGIGGYKMTKEEHALAIHLVGVVDPFVYRGVRASGGVGLTGASAGTAGSINSGSGPADNALAMVLRKPTFLSLTDTPTEIIDYILSFVESKSDLLSLALASHRLFDLIFPRHWEYRVVRCRPSDADVWKHLCADRSLARNVRVLEILDERVGMASTIGPSKSKTTTTTTTSSILVPHTLLKRTSSSVNALSSSSEDELDLHAKHTRHLSSALLRMTGLTELRWSCVHSPVSIADGSLWDAISVRAKGLRVLEVSDNLMFAPPGMGPDQLAGESESSESSGDEDSAGRESVTPRARRPLLLMESAIFRSTTHSYGASKTPDIIRIGNTLAHCPNLKTLEITYIPSRTSSSHAQGQLQPHLNNPNARPRPLLDAFLLSSLVPSSLLPSLLTHITPNAQPARWASLSQLTLTNLRCSSPGTLSAFLSAHVCLEVLELINLVLYVPAGGAGQNIGNAQTGSMLSLQKGALPRLREINAARDIITAIMECPLGEHFLNEKGRPRAGDEEEDDDGDDEVAVPAPTATKSSTKKSPRRPLETIKGFKLSGNPHHHSHTPRRQTPDDRFLTALRTAGTTIRRVEMAGWHDVEEVRRVVACAPKVNWLDVGKRIGAGPGGVGLSAELRDGLRSRGTRGDLKKGKAMERLGTREDVGMTGGAPSHMLEWMDLLATLPELATMHGVKFFYEVSSTGVENSMSTSTTFHSHTHDSTHTACPTDSVLSNSTSLNTANAIISSATRSRLRKNDEIASVLAWKCPKLRRVDHWEGPYTGVGSCGKVVVLLRDGSSTVIIDGIPKSTKDNVKGKGKDKEDAKGRERDNVRWEVRRVNI